MEWAGAAGGTNLAHPLTRRASPCLALPRPALPCLASSRRTSPYLTAQGDASKIERAFSKTMADQRKEWLRAYDPDSHVNHNADSLDYSTFIDKERIT